MTTAVPMLRAPLTRAIDEGTTADVETLPEVRSATVDPGFFTLLELEAVEGRTLEAQDGPGTEPVAVVNESFAQRHFGSTSALGQSIRLGDADSQDNWLTIVGVVPDFWMDGEQNRAPEGVYTPLAQAETPDPVARHGRLGLRYAWVIVEVDGGAIGSKAIGPMTSRLVGLFRALVDAESEKVL